MPSLKVKATASPYTPEMRAILGGMPTRPNAQRIALAETFIRSMKIGGAWQKRDGLYLHAGHEREAGKLNLKMPGVGALTEPGGTVAFTADRGFTGDGVGTYLQGLPYNSALLPHFGLDDASFAVFVVTAGTTTNNIMGQVSASGQRNTLNPKNVSGNHAAAINSAGVTAGANAGTRADYYYGGTISTTTNQSSKNAGTRATAVRSSQTEVAGAFTLLRNGTSFADDQIGFFGIGGYLTEAEELAEYNAVLAWMTAVGAR